MALLGNLKGSAHVFSETGFYNDVATQSLRFDNGSSHKLTRTFSSDVDNDKKMTISVWVKRGKLDTGSTQVILANYTAVRYLGELCFDNDTDRIRFDPGGNGDGSSNHYRVITAAEFRDTGSWYHIVLAYDSTQSTDTNRVKIYVNGEQQTVAADGSGQSFPPQNYAHEYSYNGANNTIGEFGANFNSGYLDGYLSELNFIDGLTLDPTYFGQTKDGVWIAKKYTGSYGTNGYRLEFKNTSVGSGSSSTIGADTSGNDNHWTSSGIAAHDCAMPDSPENNFSVMSDLSFPSTTDSIAEGGLRVGKTDQMVHASTFAFPTSGKWYWEIYSKSSNGSNYYMPYSGVCNTTFFHNEQDVGGNAGDGLFQKSGLSYIRGNDAKYKNLTGTSVVDGANTATEGQAGTEQGIVGFALDVDAGTIKYYWNNSLVRTDSTLTAGDEYFAFSLATNSGSNIWNYNYFNFGQDSSFVGTQTAQGNTDGNGIGDFYYSPPSGHLALCASNLPQPTIGPDSDTQADDHFNTVLYTGNATDDRAVTGVGFQPDWIWIKNRTSSFTHVLVDSSRGLSAGYIASSTSNAESGDASLVKTITSDGFTLGTSGAVNGNSASLVSWNWKANGGTTSSNSDGTITSTVQASTEAGFSIVSYTGTGSGATVGHGLGAVPQMFIVKSRDSAESWVVYHHKNTSAPETDALQLNLADATVDSAGAWNDTAPTSSVFSVGSGNASNKSGDDFIAYCFAEIDGYSKFGSYTGNGSADGPFVFTGFRPAWVLIKNTARSADWRLHDIARQPTNDDGGHILLPNSTSTEVTSEYDIDFLSNGFKLRSGDVYENGSGELITYAAFAEDPFKYANAK